MFIIYNPLFKIVKENTLMLQGNAIQYFKNNKV